MVTHDSRVAEKNSCKIFPYRRAAVWLLFLKIILFLKMTWAIDTSKETGCLADRKTLNDPKFDLVTPRTLYSTNLN